MKEKKVLTVVIIVVAVAITVLVINRQECQVRFQEQDVVFSQCEGVKYTLKSDNWDFNSVVPADNYTITLKQSSFVRVITIQEKGYTHFEAYWYFSELKGEK